jgi:hypothetical protein
MSIPVQRSESLENPGISRPSKVIGFATGMVGTLLIAAGAISGVHTARMIDFACGGILVLLGLASLALKGSRAGRVALGTVDS